MVEQLYRVEEVADLLRLGRTRVYELIASGDLRSIRIGSARRIPESALDEFLAQAATDAAPDSLVQRRAVMTRWARAGLR